jgi:pimeloyl-ACP methyl ester carboxylesterase
MSNRQHLDRGQIRAPMSLAAGISLTVLLACVSPQRADAQGSGPVTRSASTSSAGGTPPADLARRADWQMVIVPPENQAWAEVRTVTPKSAAARARIKAGDRITHVNGVRTDTPSGFGDARRASRGGSPVVLSVERDGKAREIKFTPPPLALETDPALDIRYGFITTGSGFRQRTIITRPANATGKLPSLILVPWLSCASVEVLNKSAEGMDRLLAGILRDSGFLTLRVEKPGVGDSEGPGCSRTDLKTEMAGILLALEQLKAHPDFDPDRLFVMGMSLGGGLAPLVGDGEKVRGFVSIVGVVKTWFEHMMEIERRRLTLSGKSPGEVNDALSGYAELYTEYLIRGKTPEQVITERPALKSLWYDEPLHQYGRPAAFYSQLQTLNLEAAWQKVAVPTLIVAGEYDWIMSQDDYDIMAGLVNRNAAGAATLVRWPRASHELVQYASREAAFNEEGGTFDDALTSLVVNWLKEQAGR